MNRRIDHSSFMQSFLVRVKALLESTVNAGNCISSEVVLRRSAPADTDIFYGQFLGISAFLWKDFLGSNVYRIAYIEGTGPT